jgi:hypothetical protein
MSAILKELNHKENELFKYWGGHIPEANGELNDLQREKINAVYKEHGAAYLGKINFDENERESMMLENVFKTYAGEMVYNFDADYVIPTINLNLAEMIVEFNKKSSLGLIDKIHNLIDESGGAYLIWS